MLMHVVVAISILSFASSYFFGESESFNCGHYGNDERPCSFERRDETGVVDVFFSQLKAGDEPWLYYGSSIEGMVHTIELMLAESIDSGRRNINVHIVSDIPEVLHLNFTDYIKEHVTLYNTSEPRFMKIRSDFFALYKDRHHSYNDVGYEFTCFLRWLFYNMVAEQQQSGSSPRRMQRIVTMDADIVFMHPVDTVFSRAIATLTRGNCSKAFEDFDVVVMGYGCVHFFSSTGLSKYANYVTAFYEQDVATVKNHVLHFSHYSDMDLIKEFVNENKRHRSSCLTALAKTPNFLKSRSCQRGGNQHLKIDEKVTCHDYEELGCVVASTMTEFQKVVVPKVLIHNLIDVLKLNNTREGKGVALENERELHDLVQVRGTGHNKKDFPGNLSLCYLHFQGLHKRVTVQWTLVLRHLYWRYRQLRHPHLYEHDETMKEKLFLCKYGNTDVMYLDENIQLREVGR